LRVVTSSLPSLTRESVLDGRAVGELLHLPASTVLEYARRGVLPGHNPNGVDRAGLCERVRRARARRPLELSHRLIQRYGASSGDIGPTLCDCGFVFFGPGLVVLRGGAERGDHWILAATLEQPQGVGGLGLGEASTAARSFSFAVMT
jgi:hypothetical protein